MFRDERFDFRAEESAPGPEASPAPLPWIETRPEYPYFVTESGESWTPVGQNDAVDWPELNGLFRRRDLAGVERHLRWLKGHGVTCLRLMLEYAQTEHRYIEKPIGRFVPNMVRLWDDLFRLCEKVGLYILLTPYDTFFTWIRWQHHPLNRRNGGPCASRRAMLACPATREAINARLAFASERWGGSPALFAWDIWNEMHPAHAGDTVEPLAEFVSDVGAFLKRTEQRLHGRRHPITVSVFGPILKEAPGLSEAIFRHPELDFANIHLYETNTIDNPRDTVQPALATGRLMADAMAEIKDQRPLFDSEHGPIHAFKDRKRILSEAFDDEYFRHIQWAHLASGGAGGGMRWPNRHPHVLTAGMRRAQACLSRFLPLIDWNRFDRRCWNGSIEVATPGVAAFGCGDGEQALLWLLRTRTRRKDGTLDPTAASIPVKLRCPAAPGRSYRVRTFDTRKGGLVGEQIVKSEGETMEITVPAVQTDIALVLSPAA